MKLLLLNLLLALIIPISAASQTYTNGVYVKNGKTFEVDKKFHQITTPEILFFSNGLTIKTDPSVDFTINSLFQEVFDLDKPAHTAKFGNASFAGTLMSGTIYIVYSGTNENSSIVISTPMTDLELYKGTFIVSVPSESVVMYVIEGSAKAHGEKKVVRDASAGSFIMVAPTKIGILEDKYSIGSNTIPEAGMKKLHEMVNDIVKPKDKFLFVIIDGKIVGVNIN